MIILGYLKHWKWSNKSIFNLLLPWFYISKYSNLILIWCNSKAIHQSGVLFVSFWRWWMLILKWTRDGRLRNSPSPQTEYIRRIGSTPTSTRKVSLIYTFYCFWSCWDGLEVCVSVSHAVCRLAMYDKSTQSIGYVRVGMV